MKNQINDLFDYDLKIVQNSDDFKFSLDSILLAEYVETKNANKIIDLCSGNAAVSLILSTKTDAKIIGVEYQKEVCELANESIKLNKLDNQIEMINDDVNNYMNYKQLKNADVLVCNPPYFKVNDSSLTNTNEVKSIARHEILVDLEIIIRIASQLLENKKSFYLVHRANRIDEIIILCNKYNINVKKVCLVNTKSNRTCELVLIKAVKGAKFDVKVSSINVKDMISYKGIFD